MPLRKNQITKQILLDFLVEGICKISFTKRDGSNRVAFCTLNYDLIPSEYLNSIGKTFLPDANPDIIPFWDVTHGAWKSFYVNSVNYFLSADELRKDIPINDPLHETVTNENKNADHVQDMDDNEQSKIDKSKTKQVSSLENSKINPTNKINIRKQGYSRKTKSNITEKHEQSKKSRENAVEILNRLRREAEERKRRR